MSGLTIDPCLDRYGHHTLRLSDGSETGNTSAQPIATVYDDNLVHVLGSAPELLQACERALEALRNVPCVGEKYDQQHSDTQLAADQMLEAVIKKATGQP